MDVTNHSKQGFYLVGTPAPNLSIPGLSSALSHSWVSWGFEVVITTLYSYYAQVKAQRFH